MDRAGLQKTEAMVLKTTTLGWKYSAHGKQTNSNQISDIS